VMRTVKPLLDGAQVAKAAAPVASPAPNAKGKRERAPQIDPERVRAAVTVALDAAFPTLIDEITARVLEALRR